MSDERDGERRRGDRRRSDRRAVPRAGKDRRRVDRRAGRALVFLATLSIGAGSASMASARPQTQALLVGPAAHRFPDYRAPAHYRLLIERAASRHGVNAALIAAVIRVESAFEPRAVSRKGAQGLMQLMPDTAARFGVRDVFDPEQNIQAGTRYLGRLLQAFEGNVDLACAAYNAGANTVRRYGGIPPYPETRDYVRKIRRLLGFDGETQVASATPDAAAAPARKPDVFYTWYDENGVLNVSQFPPPAGQPYKTIVPK